MKVPAISVTLAKIVIPLFLLLSLAQCKKSNKAHLPINPAFTEKIAAFTSGVISSESVIQIVLAEDYPGGDILSAPAGEGLFRFKPAVKGQAVWVDKRTIEFRPAEKLKSGETYSAKFFLSKILRVPKDIAVLEFTFSVVEQAFAVSIEGYQTHNENDLVWNRIKGAVNTSDVIDNEIIQTYFKAFQDKRNLKISWEPGSDQRTFSFTIDSVKRAEKPGRVEILWDASPDYKKINGKQEVEIPSLSDYKVMDIKVVQQPEQYVQIMFSDPIRKNQNFEGLIFLDGNTSLEYSVSGNIIKAFPVVRQSGETGITVRQGIVNILGYSLKEDFVADINFEVPKPAVRLAGKGVILPSTKGMVFPFEAVNLSAVDVKIIKIFENNVSHFLQVNRLDGSNQLKRAGRLVHKQTVLLNYEPADLGKWNRFYLDLAKLITPDPGSIYRVEISFRQKYSLYPCSNTPEESEEQVEADDYSAEMAETSYWDSYEEYYDDYDYDYDYDWEDRDDPCTPSYYRQNKWVARNILASDLGIVVKSGTDQQILCAVTNLVTAKPMEGVEVTLYNFQQQPVATGTTDNNGFVTVRTTEKPFLLIARFEKQRGYLRLDDGSSLSLGAFDVSGNAVPKGIKGFIYGERGVWRPGDTLFLTFMLQDKQKLLPASHPVIFELYNPKGQLFARSTKTSGMDGFYSWPVATSQDAPTGNWNLLVKVGGTQFTRNIKVETVKPNRLKIDLKFNTKLLSASNPLLSGNMSVIWLHGAVASNLKTSVSFTLTKAATVFEKYPDFQFTDPARSFEAEEQVLYEGYTDDNGKATIPGRIKVDRASPGMLNVNFTTRVFEKGGDFSIDRFSMPYSPYAAYVGLKTPEGDKRGMLLTDTTQWVDVVLVNENGMPVSRPDLEASVYKLDWRNWWESADDELADFVGNTYNRPVISKTIAAVNGRAKFGFRINRPDWGRFYIRIVDPVSGHAAGKIVYIDWPGWAGRPMRDNPEAASMLTFNSDKKQYTVGETAEITIPTGGMGLALFTVESGSQVLLKQWLNVTGQEIKHRFEITPEMAPNVYAYVTLIQPHANTENDMPMRLYGVIPLLVEDPQTKLAPVISMPDVLEPLQKVTVQVSEKNNKEMTYTLAIVEEGLLDLTRFKTPDPWSEFYAREALGVRTWDLYDAVIGTYGGKLASILGIGGDENVVPGESAEKANRFKPVVKYLGPFTLPAGKTSKHQISIPNYIGSIRAMVVAGKNGAYGFSEKTVPVKKPLMVLATLPRVLGPGEQVDLPVTVFAMDNQVKQVNVTVKTNGMLRLEDQGTKSVTFSQTGDKIVGFTLKVASRTGIGKVQVTASSGKYTSTHDIELDVRNANPPVTTFIGGTAESGKSWEADFSLPGMESTNTAILEVSGIPPIDAGRRLKYLISYPHGCIEQITSAVFPQLFLADVMELDDKTKAAIDLHIKAGIHKLNAFQISGGGFAYWPGNSQINSWGNSYAGHFLLEAEKKGYALPGGLKSGWLKSQKQLARQWTPMQNKELWRQDDLEQAYRLFTLALAGEPETGAMNRLREYKLLCLQAKWRLAAAYALTGQSAVAKELIARESTDIKQYNGFYSSYGSRERDWAMMLETMTLLNDQTRGADLARKISGVLSAGYWMSTQSTAYCLLAMAKFAQGRTSGKMEFTYKLMDGKTLTVASGKPFAQVSLPIGRNIKTGHISVTNKGQGVLFTRIIMEGVPAAGEEKEFSNNLAMEVRYRTLEGESLDISRLTQGTDFAAVVEVQNEGLMDYTDMALNQIFPSGWEIQNNRITDMELPGQTATLLYQDIRDDRVYTYFNLMRGERKTFVVQLNAAYAGRYYLPGYYCEAMYDNSVSAMKKGQWIEIVTLGK
jgi:alpha-2-macroglobulin